MYAFVVMLMINGTPQLFIMERGLTVSACEEMLKQPDNGLRIDGEKVAGEGRCVPERDLPDGDDLPT